MKKILLFSFILFSFVLPGCSLKREPVLKDLKQDVLNRFSVKEVDKKAIDLGDLEIIRKDDSFNPLYTDSFRGSVNGLVVVYKRENEKTYSGVYSFEEEKCVIEPNSVTGIENGSISIMSKGRSDYIKVISGIAMDYSDNQQCTVYDKEGNDITKSLISDSPESLNNARFLSVWQYKNFDLERWELTSSGITYRKYFKVYEQEGKTIRDKIENKGSDKLSAGSYLSQMDKNLLIDEFDMPVSEALIDWSVSFDSKGDKVIVTFYDASGKKRSFLTKTGSGGFYIVGNAIIYQSLEAVDPNTKNESSYNMIVSRNNYDGYQENKKYMLTTHLFDIIKGTDKKIALNGIINGQRKIPELIMENCDIIEVQPIKNKFLIADSEYYLVSGKGLTLLDYKIDYREQLMPIGDGNKFLLMDNNGMVSKIVNGNMKVLNDFIIGPFRGAQYIGSEKIFTIKDPKSNKIAFIDDKGMLLTDFESYEIMSCFIDGFCLVSKMEKREDGETYTTYGIDEEGKKTEIIKTDSSEIEEDYGLRWEHVYKYREEIVEKVSYDIKRGIFCVITKEESNKYKATLYNFDGKELFSENFDDLDAAKASINTFCYSIHGEEKVIVTTCKDDKFSFYKAKTSGTNLNFRFLPRR